MGFRLKRIETVTIKTAEQFKELARKLSAFGGTESEREDKASRKEKIKQKLLHNELTSFKWAVGTVPELKLTRRANGQHSSEVVQELTPEEWKRVVFPIFVVWEEYTCDSINDLPILFEQFDPQWSSRNNEDLVGAHLGIHPELSRKVNRQVATRVTTGLLWYRRNVTGEKNLTVDNLCHLIHDDGENRTHEFLAWCGSYLQKGKTDEMFHPAVIAAMYHTFKTATAEDCEFWKRVASGKVNLDSDTPGYKLADFLEMLMDKRADWPRSIQKHFRQGSYKPTAIQVFGTCLRAFEATAVGKKIGEVFFPGKGKKATDIAAELMIPLATSAAA